jgi:hypothetical protein
MIRISRINATVGILFAKVKVYGRKASHWNEKGVKMNAHKVMRFTAMVVTLLLLPSVSSLGICQGRRYPVPDGKLVKLKGSIANVSMVLGRGPGYFTLKTEEGQEFSIHIGPIRFLLQNGFNLSVGNEVEVQGIRTNQELVPPMIVATEVTNLSSHKTIRLRDQQMRPMWCCRRGPVSQD